MSARLQVTVNGVVVSGDDLIQTILQILLVTATPDEEARSGVFFNIVGLDGVRRGVRVGLEPAPVEPAPVEVSVSE